MDHYKRILLSKIMLKTKFGRILGSFKEVFCNFYKTMLKIIKIILLHESK